MNKKLMLFGVFLAVFVMLLMPCISAVNVNLGSNDDQVLDIVGDTSFSADLKFRKDADIWNDDSLNCKTGETVDLSINFECSDCDAVLVLVSFPKEDDNPAKPMFEYVDGSVSSNQNSVEGIFEAYDCGYVSLVLEDADQLSEELSFKAEAVRSPSGSIDLAVYKISTSGDSIDYSVVTDSVDIQDNNGRAKSFIRFLSRMDHGLPLFNMLKNYLFEKNFFQLDIEQVELKGNAYENKNGEIVRSSESETGGVSFSSKDLPLLYFYRDIETDNNFKDLMSDIIEEIKNNKVVSFSEISTIASNYGKKVYTGPIDFYARDDSGQGYVKYFPGPISKKWMANKCISQPDNIYDELEASYGWIGDDWSGYNNPHDGKCLLGVGTFEYSEVDFGGTCSEVNIEAIAVLIFITRQRF